MSTHPEVRSIEEQEYKKASADLLALYKDIASGLDSLTDIAQEYKLKAEKAWQELDEARQELIDTKIKLEELQQHYTAYMDREEATEKELRGKVATLENFARKQRDQLTAKDLRIEHLEQALGGAEQDLQGLKEDYAAMLAKLELE